MTSFNPLSSAKNCSPLRFWRDFCEVVALPFSSFTPDHSSCQLFKTLSSQPPRLCIHFQTYFSLRQFSKPNNFHRSKQLTFPFCTVNCWQVFDRRSFVLWISVEGWIVKRKGVREKRQHCKNVRWYLYECRKTYLLIFRRRGFLAWQHDRPWDLLPYLPLRLSIPSHATTLVDILTIYKLDLSTCYHSDIRCLILNPLLKLWYKHCPVANHPDTIYFCKNIITKKNENK